MHNRRRYTAIGAEITEANPSLKCTEPSFCYVEHVDGEFKESDFNVEYVEAVEKIEKETEKISRILYEIF